MKNNYSVPNWERQPLRSRLYHCKVFLRAHGYISDAQDKEITRKLLRDFWRKTKDGWE